MQRDALFPTLEKELPGKGLVLKQESIDTTVIVPRESLKITATLLKTHPDFSFDFLQSISGVDHSDSLVLLYHLYSYKHKHAIALEVPLTYEDTKVETLSDVWKAANWHEREQFDLFGFHFTGHPDLRRILLPEDWQGHPLLKSYEEPEEYHGIEHYRPDPLDQFKALDELKAKAKEARRDNAP
jgi:NADH-quinone oxidoreductase subunit C